MAKEKKEGEDATAAQPDKDATQGVTKEEGALDETVPGGRYIVGDRVVNAEGKEIK